MAARLLAQAETPSEIGRVVRCLRAGRWDQLEHVAVDPSFGLFKRVPLGLTEEGAWKRARIELLHFLLIITS